MSNQQPDLLQANLPPGEPPAAAPQPQRSLLGPQDLRCVLLDPPWSAEQGGGGKGANAHYSLLSPERVVEVVQHECPYWSRLCDSAHLWLWVTNTTVANGDAHRVAQGLGFDVKTQITWVKGKYNVAGELVPQKGLGYYSFGASEHLWLCVRGEAMKPAERPATWFAAPRTEHSVKPERSYELIEAASPAGRLEIFARRTRPGWLVWGNEV